MRPHLTHHHPDRPAPSYVPVFVTPAVIDAITRRLEDRTSTLELTSRHTSRAERAD